ncbi:MAG TPA: DUF2147 domain-containing protein [Acidiphilium sp.]|nr:DUF2147 domain-containing protein [Acidiphilium sp.]HQU24917.1 DUF2147 domain-containing protein [Acidiphilium sp.]
MAALIITAPVLLGLAVAAPTREGAMTPVGNWLTEHGGAVVQIAACPMMAGLPAASGALCGRIIGIKLDRGTAMPHDYMGQSQCDFPLLKPTYPTGDAGIWQGHIVDPRNGHVYGASLHVTPHGRLALHGFLLLPVLGETQYWTRYAAPVPPSCRLSPARRADNQRSDQPAG